MPIKQHKGRQQGNGDGEENGDGDRDRDGDGDGDGEEANSTPHQAAANTYKRPTNRRG